MAKQTVEICEGSSISTESSNNSEDQDDTLEAEISRLEATLHAIDENDLLDFSKSAEILEDDLNDIDSYEDRNPYEGISETTITNTDSIVYTCGEIAESSSREKQKSARETWDTRKTPENEVNQSKDRSQTLNVKESNLISTNVNDKTEEKDIKSSSGSTVSIENQKTLDNSTSSSEFLTIHPTIDNELEALIKSPITSGVQVIQSSLEFSPIRTVQNDWFTSSPRVTSPKESQQSRLTFPSLHTEIENKLASLVSLSQNKDTKKEQDLRDNLGISELQSSSQKPNLWQLIEGPTECKTEGQNNEKSSDSVIILDEFNLKKMSGESVLDLDISQDYEKEWLHAAEHERDSAAGPISSTPCRKEPSSLLKTKFSDLDSGSFIVLDETGEDVAGNETKIAEPFSAENYNAKDLDNSVQEVKCESKNVELSDNQELNISAKHAAVVEHVLETVAADSDKVTQSEVLPTDDKKDEGYVKTIEVIKSDYLFKSEDPEENADNFNPEWELLRKLQTDEERYKAMRERWRNLVIPDPNLDLTHHTWRLQRNKSKTLPTKGSSEIQFMFRKPLAESRHKRTLSDPSSSSEERSTKRSRTQSCTMLFDVKLQQLRQQIDDEQHRLLCEEAQAVQGLRNAQAVQKVQLQNYYHGYQFITQLYSLHQEYLQNEGLIRLLFKGARCQVESAQEKKIHSLEKASAEVRAFHKFYQGLENKEDNDTSAYLSETQLEELWETEHFYEECEKFYT